MEPTNDLLDRIPPHLSTQDHYRALRNHNNLLIAKLRVQLYIRVLLRRVRHRANNEKQKRKAKPRSCFVREWIAEREMHGHYHQLLKTLQATDATTYKYYLRMDKALFNEILGRLAPRIRKQDTNFRKAREPGIRLAMTLRFMATGEAYKSMALNFRVGPNTISKVVRETCEAIIQEYMEEVIVCPTTTCVVVVLKACVCRTVGV